VATASDALAVLPDGTVDGMAAGQVMPDGTRIVTGDEGRVVAGNVEIGPNQEAVVSGGEMRPSPPPAPPATTPAPPASSPPATKPKPASPQPAPPPATATPKPSVEPAPPSPAVEPAAPPTTAGGREHRPRDTTTTTAAAAAKPQPAPADMKLAAWYKDKLVYLAWTSYQGPDFAAYLVLRSDAPFEPSYPVDGHTSIIARIEDPGANHVFDNVDRPDGAFYRIVAVDKQQRPLAQSPATRPQAVRTQQKTTSR
jgi:hypothetical protein